MGPVLGMLEERETAARVRVEGLRKEVARLAEVLEAAEIDLDWRVIAREELVEALAASAAETTSVTGSEAEEEAAPSLAPVPGSTVPPWREGLPSWRCPGPSVPAGGPWPSHTPAHPRDHPPPDHRLAGGGQGLVVPGRTA
jgi:hypothetical protein